MYNYELKTLTRFLNTRTIISVIFKKKSRLIHYLILFGSRNINIFLESTC